MRRENAADVRRGTNYYEQRVVVVEGTEYMVQAWETADPWITRIDAYDRAADGVSWGSPVRMREYEGRERPSDYKRRMRRQAMLSLRIIDAAFSEYASRRQAPFVGKSWTGYALLKQPPFVVREVLKRFGIPIYADSTSLQLGETLLRFLGTKRERSPDFSRLLAGALIAGDDKAQLRWGAWTLEPDEMVASEERRLLAKASKESTSAARTTDREESEQ